MDTLSVPKLRPSRVRLYLALSRTPHALLDMATPALCAILWLGAFPNAGVIALGLLTAFAGYTAVYALNDVVDYRVDRQKIKESGPWKENRDLDSVYMRHPLAQGKLQFGEGLFWMAGWALVALFGSYLLNPICTVIFLVACLLEILYCLLLRVSCLRGIISGIVKNSGGIAAVFAVDPNPAPLFLVVLFGWFFCWEIGGQNIPNDWADLEEDRRLCAKTLPVHFGLAGSITILLLSLSMAFALSIAIFWVSPSRMGYSYLAGAGFAGIYFLILPAYRFWKAQTPQESFILFNRASYYPLAMLLVIMVSLKF